MSVQSPFRHAAQGNPNRRGAKLSELVGMKADSGSQRRPPSQQNSNQRNNLAFIKQKKPDATRGLYGVAQIKPARAQSQDVQKDKKGSVLMLRSGRSVQKDKRYTNALAKPKTQLKRTDVGNTKNRVLELFKKKLENQKLKDKKKGNLNNSTDSIDLQSP